MNVTVQKELFSVLQSIKTNLQESLNTCKAIKHRKEMFQHKTKRRGIVSRLPGIKKDVVNQTSSTTAGDDVTAPAALVSDCRATRLGDTQSPDVSESLLRGCGLLRVKTTGKFAGAIWRHPKVINLTSWSRKASPSQSVSTPRKIFLGSWRDCLSMRWRLSRIPMFTRCLHSE